jgi:hypothetical protein
MRSELVRPASHGRDEGQHAEQCHGDRRADQHRRLPHQLFRPSGGGIRRQRQPHIGCEQGDEERDDDEIFDPVFQPEDRHHERKALGVDEAARYQRGLV